MIRPADDDVRAALRAAGARFALVFGSVAEGTAQPGSDLDVGAWWGGIAPHAWEVPVPDGVDLVVLDEAPWWLTGRIALRGRLLFDDDPPARVAWQAETRLRYLDDLPQLLETQRTWRGAITGGR